MAITQTIATLPAVLNDSATFYEDIAERNNSLVTTVLPSINAWATQANLMQTEINAKALQVASQAVDGGYSQNYINSNFFSQTYINTNFVGVNNAQTIAGIKTFSSSPIVPTPTKSGDVITMDNIIQKTAVGIGYGNGSGGTVTQLTSKSTAVTLNKPTGRIIMNNSAIASLATEKFDFNNSLISANDNIIVTLISGDANVGLNYKVWVGYTNTGLVAINVQNTSATSRSEALVLKFDVIKGAIL